MLTELRIENFKCFGPELVIPCSRLNLLTGINGKGKSTSLQALLLLHQSIDLALAGSGTLSRLELNGRHARLGTFREVRNRDRPKGDPVQIGLEFADDDGATVTSTRLAMKQELDDARWIGISRVEVERFVGDELDLRDVRSARGEALYVALMLGTRSAELGAAGVPPVESTVQQDDTLARVSALHRLGRVHYVSADRLGPQGFFPWSDERDVFSVGVRGERTAEVLYRAAADQEKIPLDDVRAEKDSETELLTDHASAWLSYVFDGAKLRVSAPHSTILTLEMNADRSAIYHSPVHLGFGYSYVLPILVAGLIARPGDILIAENPEAHLHPLAQSRIGEFLARVSAAGVQVFVESHSEHILNAFRLAVKERHVAAGALNVLYFRQDRIEPVLRIPVEADGGISYWPDGFFDQRTRDFIRLFGEQ